MYAGAGIRSVGPLGTSSAQLWVLVIAAGVAALPVSVSARSRGTVTQLSGPDSADTEVLGSQLVPAAAFAAPASILEASGTVGVST